MRYPVSDLASLWPHALWGDEEAKTHHLFVRHFRAPDDTVYFGTVKNALSDASGHVFMSVPVPPPHEESMRFLAPSAVGKKRRAAQDYVTDMAWAIRGDAHAGALCSASIWHIDAPAARRNRRRRDTGPEGVPFDGGALADAVCSIAMGYGWAPLRLDRHGVSMQTHSLGRVALFADPLPLPAESVLSVDAGRAYWWGAAVRLFMQREGRVTFSLGNVALPGLPLWRFTAEAPSGARVVLDLPAAPRVMRAADLRPVVSTLAAEAVAVAAFDDASWGARLTGEGVRDLSLAGDALSLVNPSTGVTRTVRAQYVEGAATTSAAVYAIASALAFTGKACRLFVTGNVRDPLLFAHRNGRGYALVLPSVRLRDFPTT